MCIFNLITLIYDTHPIANLAMDIWPINLRFDQIRLHKSHSNVLVWCGCDNHTVWKRNHNGKCLERQRDTNSVFTICTFQMDFMCLLHFDFSISCESCVWYFIYVTVTVTVAAVVCTLLSLCVFFINVSNKSHWIGFMLL